MNFSEVLKQFNFTWPNFVFIAIRLIFIAVTFEFIAWWAGRRLEKIATPFIGLDQNRDAKWRASRRATLKTSPRFVSRTLIYTVALVLVFNIFGVEVLPLSLAIAAVSALLGLAFVPLMRDYSQGYALLSEDTLAPGDVVSINGHEGQVEKWTLRATWLRDDRGHIHVLSNRDVRDVVIMQKAKAAEAVETKAKTGKKVAFDPLTDS